MTCPYGVFGNHSWQRRRPSWRHSGLLRSCAGRGRLLPGGLRGRGGSRIRRGTGPAGAARRCRCTSARSTGRFPVAVTRQPHPGSRPADHADGPGRAGPVTATGCPEGTGRRWRAGGMPGPRGGRGHAAVQGQDQFQYMVSLRARQDRLDSVRAAGLLGDRLGATADVPAQQLAVLVLAQIQRQQPVTILDDHDAGRRRDGLACHALIACAQRARSRAAAGISATLRAPGYPESPIALPRRNVCLSVTPGVP
jgi:hypothetical protein